MDAERIVRATKNAQNVEGKVGMSFRAIDTSKEPGSSRTNCRRSGTLQNRSRMPRPRKQNVCNGSCVRDIKIDGERCKMTWKRG
jgi:hypothetical protein